MSRHSLVFLGGDDYGHVTILTAGADVFALSTVNHLSKSLLGFGGRNRFHMSILDKLDNMIKINLDWFKL